MRTCSRNSTSSAQGEGAFEAGGADGIHPQQVARIKHADNALEQPFGRHFGEPGLEHAVLHPHRMGFQFVGDTGAHLGAHDVVGDHHQHRTVSHGGLAGLS
jgi:hypothetical protein